MKVEVDETTIGPTQCTTACCRYLGMTNTMERVDVVVVGAGISGISLGHYLRTLCPSLTVAILERREAVGGTWDLNQYPGIRSVQMVHRQLLSK